MVDKETKTCRGPCGKEKALEEFYKHPTAKDGRYHLCKPCARQRAAEYRERTN